MANTKPTVVVDGTVFENKGQIGIWRIFYEVMHRTSRQVNYLLILQSRAQQPIPSGVNTVQIGSRRRRRPLEYLRRAARLWSLERSFRETIWHPTFYTAKLWPSQSMVVTAYDMCAELQFGLSEVLEAQIERKRPVLEEADACIAISRSTRDDLERLFPRWKDRCFVTLLGKEHLPTTDSSLNSATRRDCLFVGSRQHYKNFSCILNATSLPCWPENLKVNVVGAPLTKHERRLIEYHGVESHVDYRGRPSDKELADLYRQHRYFIFPSLFEGFGLPTIEAQAAGCIPVLSDIAIFREIAGSGAAYFDSRVPESLATLLANLETNPTQIDRMRDTAYVNLSKFSWTETAKQTRDCYELLWKQRS